VKWRAGLDRAMPSLNRTSTQYSVLASPHGLSQSGTQPSQRELAEFAGLESMFVSALARALQRGALLQRRAHTTDPRALQLSLTPRGLKVLKAARKIVVQLEERRLAVLGGHDSHRSTAFKESLLTLFIDAAATTSAPPTRHRPAAKPKPRTSFT
jgi:MarR family transcriptional regulator, organic hydroperoxide resistance regulator